MLQPSESSDLVKRILELIEEFRLGTRHQAHETGQQCNWLKCTAQCPFRSAGPRYNFNLQYIKGD